MFQPVYYIADGLISPLGSRVADAYTQVSNGISAICKWDDESICHDSFYAARIANDVLATVDKSYSDDYSILEKLCISTIKEALSKCTIETQSKDCVFIFSSTKGNIEWLHKYSDERILLNTSANNIAKHFNNPNPPIIISNACISGSAAIIMAKRLLQNNHFNNAVVIGADRLSRFVLSGFQSFQAIASEPCKPFDRDRKGINLGEAAACIILSTTRKSNVAITGGAISNDANHLSGPSRTGDELANAIKKTINEAAIRAEDIDMVSAHGTATLFNDEMESKAIATAGLSSVSLHSLKSYVGHTLGAAGIIESIMACKSMMNNVTIQSLGYENNGVPATIKVETVAEKKEINNILKTASGFGGCNAALLWSKTKNFDE